MASYLHVTVSQKAEEQAFLVKDIDGAKIIITLTTQGAAVGSLFGGPGAIIGAVVGAITGIFTAIFGDKKKGAMNMYRTLLAEIMGQVDPGAVLFIDEHTAVQTTRPADPDLMLDICRQMLVAFQSTFDPGSDDWYDAQEAINTVKLESVKPCCNRTIVTFEVLEPNGITNILSGTTGGAIAVGIGAWLLTK